MRAARGQLAAKDVRHVRLNDPCTRARDEITDAGVPTPPADSDSPADPCFSQPTPTPSSPSQHPRKPGPERAPVSDPEPVPSADAACVALHAMPACRL